MFLLITEDMGSVSPSLPMEVSQVTHIESPVMSDVDEDVEINIESDYDDSGKLCIDNVIITSHNNVPTDFVENEIISV